ncbi:MAG: AAA family ATPase [Gammaproteobacteria bacterium]
MTFYLQHFGLREAPFGATPMTEFFYGGGRRGEILHTLQYAINAGEGIVMVTGEVGSGKTMLLRSLLEKLQHQNIDLVYIPNPSLSGREILYNICEELELRMDENRPDTVRMLQNCLIDRYAKGRRVVALIDEAQAMPDDSLEEIRLLSNLETGRGKLLQIVLFGQPELEDKLRQQNMRQLRERITLALELKPFGLDDVRDYISTRLNAAGYDGGSLFSGGALKLITAVSHGLSRRINVLADKALLSAFERQSVTVTSADAKRAVRGAKYGKFQFYVEQKQEPEKPFLRRRAAALAFASAAAIAAVVALSVWGGWFADKLPAQSQTAPPQQSEQTPPAQSETTPAAQPEQTPAAEDQTALSAQGDDASAGQSEMETAAQESGEQQPPLLLSDGETPPNDGLLPPIEQQTLPGDNVDDTTTPDHRQQNTTAAQDNAALPAQSETALLGQDETTAQNETATQNEPAPAAQNETPLLGQDETALAAPTQSQSQSQSGGGGYVVDKNLPQFALPGEAAGDIGDNARWRDLPPDSYLRARLNATDAFLNSPGGLRGHTGRLMTVMQERAASLDKFLRRFANFYPLGNVMVYPLRLGDTERFVVTFGIYEDRDYAAVFVGNIPREFTDGRPFVQSLEESAREAAAF